QGAVFGDDSDDLPSMLLVPAQETLTDRILANKELAHERLVYDSDAVLLLLIESQVGVGKEAPGYEAQSDCAEVVGARMCRVGDGERSSGRLRAARYIKVRGRD